MRYITIVLVFAGLLIIGGFCQVSAEEMNLEPINFGQAFPYPCDPSFETETYSTMNAAFTADKVTGVAPFEVGFYDASFGFPSYYHWDFGDGSYSSDKNPVHVYEEAGSYDVALTISDGIYEETTWAVYNATGSGQLTSITFSSTTRELDYITVLEAGSEEAAALNQTDEVDPSWYPVRQKGVTMPSGQLGVAGSAYLDASTITVTNDTQSAYKDTLAVSGIYRIFKQVPHSTSLSHHFA